MRYHKAADGTIAYYRLEGREFNQKIVDWGECVLCLKPKSKGKFKGDRRWETGVWVGIREESGEHICLTERGAIKCRAIRRMPQASAWDWEMFSKVTGMPWEPVPGQPNSELKIRVGDGMRDRPVLDPTEGNPKEYQLRSFPIKATDLKEHGTTKHCRGCDAYIRGGEHGKHNLECRNRFFQILTDANDPRLERQAQRHMTQSKDEPKSSGSDDIKVDNEDEERDEIIGDPSDDEREQEGTGDAMMMNLDRSINFVGKCMNQMNNEFRICVECVSRVID